MKKYAEAEGNLEVLRGREAQVMNDHLQRVGKAVSDFDTEEKKALQVDLEQARKENKEEDDEPATD